MSESVEEVKVMGVKFSKLTLDEAINKAFLNIKGIKKGYICTPNPEMLLTAEKDTDFKHILNNSLFNIPDGIGILWAATIQKWNSKILSVLCILLLPFFPNFFKKNLKERVTGVDLFKNICKHSPSLNLRIFLLGAKHGVAEEVSYKLKKEFPGIKIVGTHSGSPSVQDEKDIIEIINLSYADILFVAYGAPKQEKWIYKNLKHLNSVRLAVGIGGTFDFIAGEKKRAPKWMQKLGIEWLFRVIQEPSRIKRIINAVFVFPSRVLKNMK